MQTSKMMKDEGTIEGQRVDDPQAQPSCLGIFLADIGHGVTRIKFSTERTLTLGDIHVFAGFWKE